MRGLLYLPPETATRLIADGEVLAPAVELEVGDGGAVAADGIVIRYSLCAESVPVFLERPAMARQMRQSGRGPELIYSAV